MLLLRLEHVFTLVDLRIFKPQSLSHMLKYGVTHFQVLSVTFIEYGQTRYPIGKSYFGKIVFFW